MGFVIRLRNLSPGPWKLRFKANTPVELRHLIDAVVKPGGRLLIPEAAAEFVDQQHLVQCQSLGVISYQTLSMERKIPVVPITKVVAPTPHSLNTSVPIEPPLPAEEDKKREFTPSKRAGSPRLAEEPQSKSTSSEEERGE
jgi:hypothetical protein